MVIRPTTMGYGVAMNRSNAMYGGRREPTTAAKEDPDVVRLGTVGANAGLYTGRATFKLIGAIELFMEDAAGQY